MQGIRESRYQEKPLGGTLKPWPESVEGLFGGGDFRVENNIFVLL